MKCLDWQLRSAGGSNTTSFSGFTFLIPTVIITETDLQQLLCMCTCLSSRGSLLIHGKGAHVGSIWSVAHSDPFKAWKSLFEPLLFCCACVRARACVRFDCIYWDHYNENFPPSWCWNPTTVQQMLSASFCEVRSSFTILFSGFTLSIKPVQSLFYCYLLHICTWAWCWKLLWTVKLVYFSKTKLRTQRRVWLWMNKAALIPFISHSPQKDTTQ